MRVNEVYSPKGCTDRAALLLVRQVIDGKVYLSKVDERSSSGDCIMFDSQAAVIASQDGFRKRYMLCGRTRAAYRGSASACRYVLQQSRQKPYMRELIEADRQYAQALQQALSWSGRDRTLFLKAADYVNELDSRINENCERAHIDRQELDDIALVGCLVDYDEEGVQP